MPVSAPDHVLRVLDRLQGVRAAGNGWEARCPAHDDSTPSLHVAVGNGERVLMHCHAGCPFNAIVASLGLRPADLFARQNGGSRRRPSGTLVRTHDYHDEHGAVLFQVCRYAQPKAFRQRRPDGRGGWIRNVEGVPVVPYRLPQLQVAVALGILIYVVEGEKDVEALDRLGITATCNAGGAGKWRPAHADYLRGAHVVILPDNDDPGRAHVQQVAASLYGVAASLRVVELPGLPEHGDVSDWLARGGTVEALRELCDATEEWSPPFAPDAAPMHQNAASCGSVAEFTDVAHAERLARLHADRIRYVSKWATWIVWDAGCWLRDDRGVRVMELAKDIGRDLLRQAAEEADDDRRSKLTKAAVGALSAAKIRAAVELARGIPALMVEPDDLDRDGWLLCVRNGVIDLRTGTHRPAHPAALMTMQAPVDWVAGAAAPRWEHALAEWFPDQEVRAYVQRLAGAALVGEQRDHVFVIHYGGGANGKGTFTRGLQAVLGPYAATPHMSLLVQQRHAEHDTIKASLFRARLAVASEAERRVKLAEASIKNLTGRDRITCRRMRENPWEFTPTHSLWLQTNYLPEIAGRDQGIWRRVKVVPWVARFDGDRQDAGLDEALATEASGILRWAVEGCIAWQRDGLREPEAVVRATLRYRDAEDVFSRFVTECGFEIERGLRTPKDAIAAAFRDWAQAEGVEARAARDLSEWLQERGCRQTNPVRIGGGQRVRFWEGVGRRGEAAEIAEDPGW
jgi:putative DNA primase/helicase